jgi:hypothetical protein
MPKWKWMLVLDRGICQSLCNLDDIRENDVTITDFEHVPLEIQTTQENEESRCTEREKQKEEKKIVRIGRTSVISLHQVKCFSRTYSHFITQSLPDTVPSTSRDLTTSIPNMKFIWSLTLLVASAPLTAALHFQAQEVRLCCSVLLARHLCRVV